MILTNSSRSHPPPDFQGIGLIALARNGFDPVALDNIRSMTPLPAEASTLYAYLTVTGDLQSGLVGGALVIDSRGRPVEFHCTEPVLVSRADEILYGATLTPHIFCDRIATSLLARLAGKGAMVIIDRPELEPLARDLSLPVVRLVRNEATEEAEPAGSPCEEVTASLDLLKRYIPLDEPLGRIVEALREAAQVAPHDEVSRDQAA